jgi:hypothetical protein
METFINDLLNVVAREVNPTVNGTVFLQLVKAALGLIVTDGLLRIGWDNQFTNI